MRFVTVKSEEKQACAVVFRTRDLLVRQRTQVINALRGHLAEYGNVARHGPARVAKLIADVRTMDASFRWFQRLHFGASMAGGVHPINFSLLRRWFTELLRGLLWISFATYRNHTLRKTVLRNVLRERLYKLKFSRQNSKN